MRCLCHSERLNSCLTLCLVLHAGLSLAGGRRFRHISFEVSKEGALLRRQASEIQPLMAGPYTETYLSIPGLTTDSVTVKTLTQPPLTTAITLPVYFCSGTTCTATVDGALTQFNAEIQWPATITASAGVMSPPPWANQTLSVGCDSSIYTYGAPGPTLCPSANTASSSPNLNGSSAGTGIPSVTGTDSGNLSPTTVGGSATASSGDASGSDTATTISGTPSLVSGISSTMSPNSGGASGTGAGNSSNVSPSSGNSASDTGAGTISTTSGASSATNPAAQSNMTGVPAASSGSTNSVTGSSIRSTPSDSLSSNAVSESSAGIRAGSSTLTAGNGITSVVPGSLGPSRSEIQSSVNSTFASNNPTSIPGSGLSFSLSSISTASTAASLMTPESASISPSPTASSNGGGGGHQPTMITSAPSSTYTAFVFGSSVESAVSSATAAVDDATDQINQLQNNQNNQNLKQNVLNLINQANTVAHTGGIGWLFGILGTAASEAEAVVKGTAPVADLVNAWENVEKAESEYSSSSSESSESSSQSERSQRSESTQSGTITSANPSSSNPRTVSSTAMSSSSMSSRSSASSSVSSCASGCTLNQVTLASVALDPSMSENLAAISSVELMASSWDNPSAWGVMGNTSQTGASSSMPSSTGSASNSTTSATASIASTTTKGAISTSSSGPSQITVAPSDFMADGAPWFNPTSWCDYGSSGAKYPILTPSSGTLNCDYSTLPASTINPVSTTVAPTNVPGLNGVPGCNMELAGDQQACPGVDACNCGGTYVPVLTAVVGGSATSNCDYKIQPTAKNCPVLPTTVAPPASTPTAASPTPTIGTLICNPKSETDGCHTSDVHAGSVDATADYMGEQYSLSTFTSTSANFTRTYRDGGASGKGVTYMMSIGWVQGCAEFASQRPDRPIDSGVEFDWEGLLKDTYYNCTGNAGLGGYVDVGCLRYGFFPNKVDGVFGANGPADPELFWKTMHYC